MAPGIPADQSLFREFTFRPDAHRIRRFRPDFFRRSATEKDEGLKPYYCYILRCADGTLYTGITNDLERRVAVHNKGKGGAYTASRLPVEPVYTELIGSKGDALRRELEIKSLTRSQKLALVNGEDHGKQ